MEVEIGLPLNLYFRKVGEGGKRQGLFSEIENSPHFHLYLYVFVYAEHFCAAFGTRKMDVGIHIIQVIP